jgi:hypothetical protein
MKKVFTSFFISLGMVQTLYALQINEIMSNPTGDDSGREWVELYNDSESSSDLTSLTLSIKGGSFVPVTPVSGGVILSPHGYAIIGSTVSGATKFTQDYPSYSGILLKASMSLVNTGVTSIELKANGVSADSISSYTGAKEGTTYARFGSSFSAGTPTPGAENVEQQALSQEATTTTTSSQITIAQVAPSSDIVLYTPLEKVAIAGAPTTFSVHALTHAGKAIEGMLYSWSFGDGGGGYGSTTVYRYLYPGRYITQVEGSNGLIAGEARTIVRVVAPELSISSLMYGIRGAYLTITNPSPYDIDVSGWKISLNKVMYTFPKNTLLGQGSTIISGQALGFASSSKEAPVDVALLFPTNEEVIRAVYEEKQPSSVTLQTSTIQTQTFPTSTQKSKIKESTKSFVVLNKKTQQGSLQQENQKATTTTVTVNTSSKKDTRIASFLRGLFR